MTTPTWVTTGRLLVAVAVLMLGVCAPSAEAQSRVRVNDDQTTIWRAGFTITAGIASAGTVLDVLGKTGTWFEVVWPNPGGPELSGFVAASRVTPLDNAPVRERRGPASGDTSVRHVPALAGRVFLQGGYGRFAAAKTFDSVLGAPGGAWFGAGVQVRMRSGLYAEGTVDHFQKTGTRVFVQDGEVFDLGVKNIVRLIPLAATVGYRRPTGSRTTIYVGGGAGVLSYRETAPVATDDETVKTSFPIYHATAGVEIATGEPAALAIEAQYQTTRDALEDGVAAVFGERDLGSLQFRLKLLFGR